MKFDANQTLDLRRLLSALKWGLLWGLIRFDFLICLLRLDVIKDFDIFLRGYHLLAPESWVALKKIADLWLPMTIHFYYRILLYCFNEGICKKQSLICQDFTKLAEVWRNQRCKNLYNIFTKCSSFYENLHNSVKFQNDLRCEDEIKN